MSKPITKARINEAIKEAQQTGRAKQIGDGNNLFLSLSSKNIGRGTWSVIIRDPKTGKQERVGLGPFNKFLPEESVTLEEARIKAQRKLKEAFDKKEELREERKEEERLTAVRYKNKDFTIAELVERYISRSKLKLRPNSIAAYNRYLSKIKAIGLDDKAITINNIRNKDIIIAFDNFYQQGKIATIQQCLALINTAIKQAYKLELIDRLVNFDAGLLFPNNHKSKMQNALNAEDLPKLIEILISDKSVSNSYKVFYLLLILTLCRANEIAHMQEEELEHDDIYGDLLRISAERMKGKEEHLISLTPLAFRLVKLHFYINNKFLNKDLALQTLKRIFTDYSITLHGFRATGSTYLNKYYPLHGNIIAMCIAHKNNQSAVDLRYNRYQYLTQKKEMWDAWCAYLEENTAINQLVDQIEQEAGINKQD